MNTTMIPTVIIFPNSKTGFISPEISDRNATPVVRTAKKHGINLDEKIDKSLTRNNVSFGFYGSMIIFLVFVIAFSRILYFFQDLIILKLPFTEYYLEYFFESIKNLFEIWKNLISNY